MIVVDASVVAPALADDGSDGAAARRRLRGERLMAPALLDLEVLSVWRRQRAGGALDEARAAAALQSLLDLPLTRVEVRPVLGRCWELRHVLTVYAASYVALAETLGLTLVTADRRLSGAPGLRWSIEVLAG